MLGILRAATRARPLPTDLCVLLRATWRGWVRVCRDEHGLAGFAIRDGARLHALYVRPGAQGRGVGRCLLTDAQNRAGRLDLWVLRDNRRARRFYIRSGFAEKARVPHGGGNDERLPDILMVWPPERRVET